MKITNIFILFILSTSLQQAFANIPASGTLTAIRDCEAFQSFNRATNPGLIKLSPGNDYRVVEVNKIDYAWIRVDTGIDSVQEPLRWVPKSCGLENFQINSSNTDVSNSDSCKLKNTHDSNVLAISWQPGFCEHVSNGASKPECQAMLNEDLVISHFTLHGLWPNKASCGTSYGNCGGEAMVLEEDTLNEITPWMPNFFYSSSFGSYEWKKHGTCQTLTDDQYFLRSIKLVKLFDNSKTGQFIKEYIGTKLSVTSLNEVLDEEFGKNAGNKIQLVCKNRTHLNEIQINLPRLTSDDFSLKELIIAAPGGKRFKGNCDDEIYIERSGPN